MQFCICRHLCNPHLITTENYSSTQMFPSLPFSVTTPLPTGDKHSSGIYNLPSVLELLSVLKFHVYGIIQYVSFCVWLLSLNIIAVRFIHNILSFSSLFFCISKNVRRITVSTTIGYHGNEM